MIKVLSLHKWYAKDKPDAPMVGFNEFKVEEWIEANQDVEIRCEWERMTLLAGEIKSRILFTGTKYYTDKKTGKQYRLVNFAWKKDKVGSDPVKQRQARKDKKKATMLKAYELSNKLHAQDPEAWYKKYVLGQ